MAIVCEDPITIMEISTIRIVSTDQANGHTKMIDIITRALKVILMYSLTNQSLRMIIETKTFINTNEIGVVMC